MPLSASPITSIPGSRSSARITPSRTSGWSSATSTRIFIPVDPARRAVVSGVAPVARRSGVAPEAPSDSALMASDAVDGGGGAARIGPLRLGGLAPRVLARLLLSAALAERGLAVQLWRGWL